MNANEQDLLRQLNEILIGFSKDNLKDLLEEKNIKISDFDFEELAEHIFSKFDGSYMNEQIDQMIDSFVEDLNEQQDTTQR